MARQGRVGPHSSALLLPEGSTSEPARGLEDLAIGGMPACGNRQIWNTRTILAVPAVGSNFEISQGYIKESCGQVFWKGWG